MLVYSVLDDAMLSHAAKCIFANLVRARKRGTAFTTIGLGLLAKKSQCSISTVRLGVAQLVAQKHIKIRNDGKTERRTYILQSTRFAAAPRNSILGESAGEVIESYRADGVDHLRIVQSREPVSQPRSARKSA